jgi:hypothetical protein
MSNIEQIKEIINNKVDDNLNSVLEDIQTEIEETIEGVLEWNDGLLPPRFRELKDELNKLILSYMEETIVIDGEYVDEFPSNFQKREE